VILPITPTPRHRPTFEDVFFEHRAELHQWALQLTGRNYAQAEDLVQELYVRFARVGPIPEYIENGKYYLLTTLRNLHYKLVKRARAYAIDDLSVVDYESAERSFRAADRAGVYFIQEDVHCACDYLCERKNTSRAASIFILRYFLGYFPNEVMVVVRSTRGAVDKAIRAARNEARLERERPGVLQQFRNDRSAKIDIPKTLSDSYGFFAALRNKIFRSCTGDCFSDSVLKGKYEESGDGFTITELAHLVSCPNCLDRANRILGLPLLSERSPDEVIGRDTPGQGGAFGGSAPSASIRFQQRSQDRQALLKRMQRRLEEVNQHRPQRLSISVDGDIRASQRVTAKYSELLAELRRSDKLAFVEVLSEQGVCLAFVLVRGLASAGGLQQAQDIQLSDGRMLNISISFVSESPVVRVIYDDPLYDPDAEQEEGAAGSLPAHPTIQLPRNSHTTDLSPRFKWRINMNPLLASAMLFGLCTIICLLLWTRSAPRISAGTLLSRAEQSDASASKAGKAGVIYQKIQIRVSRRAVERAIYRDPQGKRRLKPQHLNAQDQRLKDNLVSAGVNWDDPLSAANFRDWHDHLSAKDVVTRPGVNLLRITTSTDVDGSLSKESLTVRESDFHPVERTLELRDVGEIEIAELNYDVMSWDAVNQDWFEPQATTIVTTDVPHGSHLPHFPSQLELDEAELSVGLCLHEAGVDMGDDIRVARTRRSIVVTGIVNSTARTNDLQARLASIPHVETHLTSSDQPVVDQPFGMTRLPIKEALPVAKESQENSQARVPPLLKDWLLERFSEDDQRSAYVTRTLHLADQAVWRADALQRLTARYSDFSDPRVHGMAADHQIALSDLLDTLSHDLQQLPGGAATPPTPSLAHPDTTHDVTANLKVRVDELRELLTQLLAEHDAPVRILTGRDPGVSRELAQPPVTQAEEKAVEAKWLLRSIP
jgi:DNA-directed RNA polymerase specialized sigma24 family protein